MPGCLTKALRGQHLAEVTAIGITGTPHWMASRVPPVLYSPTWPRSMRVPSGNITIQVPCAVNRLPAATIFLKACVPWLRSMWIMSIQAMAQPKNGT